MKIVVAPDSFGGALDSVEAARAISAGWSSVRPGDEVVVRPMADGGEGTLRALASALGDRATVRRQATVDPLGRPIEAEWLLLDGRRTAFVELAAASGLALLAPDARDPRRATTRGTGILVRGALDAGVERITIGLGGSATNDAGAGLLAELGLRLFDADGRHLPDGGAALARLARIDASRLDPRLARVHLTLATDVTNPLCGPNGASAVYGPQKGADADAVPELDAALGTFAAVVEATNGRAVAALPGAGAAGGAGAGLLAFTSAKLRSGAEVVAELIGLAESLDEADLVITGEGRADAQTLSGKTASHVAALAPQRGTPAVLLCGALDPSAAERLEAAGFALVQPISDGPMNLDEALGRTAELLTAAGRRLAQAMELGITIGDRPR